MEGTGFGGYWVRRSFCRSAHIRGACADSPSMQIDRAVGFDDAIFAHWAAFVSVYARVVGEEVRRATIQRFNVTGQALQPHSGL